MVRGQGEQQSEQILATIDQSDIRGSKPHNLDPSGAASKSERSHALRGPATSSICR